MNALLDGVLASRMALLPAKAQIDTETLLSRDLPAGAVARGRMAANRYCRLLRCRRGWSALNLARDDDFALIPALTGGGTDWLSVRSYAAAVDAETFVAAACDLHLPVARLGEAAPAVLAQPRSAGAAVSRLRVVDCSALWAGPLCSGLLAAAGAQVLRIQSCGRPDPTPQSSPRLDQRINGNKQHLVLDFSIREGRQRLLAEVLAADVLVTSARSCALARLGLDPAAMLAARPGLIWLAITAHGWAAERVGFGDDCAVAGGLVGWTGRNPYFLADALADPLTGLEGAVAVLARVAEGRGGLLDLSLAGTAAAYAGLT